MENGKIMGMRRGRGRRSVPPTAHSSTRGKVLFLTKDNEPPPPPDKRHTIIAFIEDHLFEEKEPVLGGEEFSRLLLALRTLLQMFPVVEPTIIEAVRQEYARQPNPPPATIAQQERRVWEDYLAVGKTPIPDFDYYQALMSFVPDGQKADRLVFLKPEYHRLLPAYPVPYRFRTGEMFFHIILKMFRKQYNLERTRQQLAQMKTDPPPLAVPPVAPLLASSGVAPPLEKPEPKISSKFRRVFQRLGRWLKN